MCFSLVVVGAGPAGLMLATCLARWGYKIKHIDNRPHPTRTGRADGIQPRSLDLLRNMGLKAAIMSNKPARVYEVAFWDPSKCGRGIVRTGTWASCPSFIAARYPFTTLLHQGLIENVFIADLAKNDVQIQRPWAIKGFTRNKEGSAEYPIDVLLEHVDGTFRETVKTKYIFGADGARSSVRDMLKIKIQHIDPISFVWGVMDGVVRTDFPDIKVSSPSGRESVVQPGLLLISAEAFVGITSVEARGRALGREAPSLTPSGDKRSGALETVSWGARSGDWF